ncbi:unnamed protein product [Caenorhabditis bovis]|uniref:Uncharacterized protein n=1 Tax=Caenorhabditis bovis TaxID=2654633 RepID=A0A8S1EJM5_9PELO|nr:unnamed protein product [Caenorhabditis bovis]
MADELTSPTVKSGNVLALLNTLYASGFAMASSSTPLLKGKTLHTLYALSFVVYVINTVCSWVHVSFVVKGYVTSFPLNNWIVVSLVIASVTGSMLTWLLFVLCIENAFAHRLDVKPYRSGCALLFEAFIEWTQAFNNFRMSFLIMLLHDAPITIFNYFYIAACRCPSPKVLSWPIVVSSISCTASLMWRITVLYFSYRRMLFGKKKKQVSGVAVQTPTKQHFQQAIDTSSASNGGRLNEYDETWPIRWARIATLGPHPDKDTQIEQNGDLPQNDIHEAVHLKPEEKLTQRLKEKMHQFCAEFDFFCFCRNVIGYSMWIILSIIIYILMTFIACIPCIYHYTCRHNSFYHRHKLCRSFIRYFSMAFHRVIFASSLIFSLLFATLNITLLSSVHGLGSNTFPPEIDRICVTITPESKTIYTSILPQPVFQRPTEFKRSLNRKYAPNDKHSVTECKPLWEDGGLGIGLARREAGIWEMRTQLENLMLSVATHVTFNNTDPQNPALRLEYSHTIFIRHNETSDERFSCIGENGWKVIPSVGELSWPYFSACSQNWQFGENSDLIECNQFLKYRKHPTRHSMHNLRTYSK